MNIEEIIKKLDDIWNNCEEIDNNNPETERTGYKMYDDYIFVRKGIKRLHSIIKEAREYMNDLRWFEMFTKEHDITLYASTKDFYRDIKKILDKVEEK